MMSRCYSVITKVDAGLSSVQEQVSLVGKANELNEQVHMHFKIVLY